MTASLFPNICWSLVIFWKSTCQSGISSDSRWQEWPVSVPVAFFFLCLFLFFCFSVTSCLILKSSSPGVFTSCQILHVFAACILLLSLLPHAFLPHARKRCHKSGFFDRTCGLTLDLLVLTWQTWCQPHGWSSNICTERPSVYLLEADATGKNTAISICSNYNWSMSLLGDLRSVLASIITDSALIKSWKAWKARVGGLQICNTLKYCILNEICHLDVFEASLLWNQLPVWGLFGT